MRITVITVCFNSEKTIGDTIESLLLQTNNVYEHIFVDGMSEDKTLEIIKSYIKRYEHKNIKLKIIKEQDEGLYDAMNKGIRSAIGDYITILNSDDIFYENNTIEKVKTKLIKDKPDILYGDILIMDSSLKKIKRKWISKKGNISMGWTPPHPGTYIKKSVYNKYGIYKKNYKISADYDFFVRTILLNKVSLFYFNSYLIKMRGGGESTRSIKSYLIGNNEILNSLKENKIKNRYFIVFMKLIRKIKQLFFRHDKEIIK